MTSVKELGETLRKRQAAAEGAEATEEAMLGAVGSAYAVLLVAGGCLVLALGALMASVDVVAPDHRWMAESLERMGITSGAVLAAGLSLLGLGVIAKELAQAQRALLSAVRRAGGATAVGEGLEELREGLGKVHFALRVLQESTKSLLEISHENAYKREDSEHGDAVFRLAASLDQLGLRLEDRLDSQQSGIELRLGSLDSALEETRRRIADWLESSAIASAALEVRDGSERPSSRKARRRAGSREDERAERRPSTEGRRGSGREADEDAGELEVLVTLEERPGERDGAARGGGGRRTPLGVLDVLDEFGQGLDADDGDGAATADFLFDPQLSARLDELGGLEDEDEDQGVETQAKLAQLQSLLSDAKLRRVLDELRDAGGARD